MIYVQIIEGVNIIALRETISEVFSVEIKSKKRI